jgi:hypothetical protein
MNRSIFALLFLTSVSLAHFSDDQYAEPPDVLSRVVQAAEREGSQFRSSIAGGVSYYLRKAEYIGHARHHLAPSTSHAFSIFVPPLEASKVQDVATRLSCFSTVSSPSAATGRLITRSAN